MPHHRDLADVQWAVLDPLIPRPKRREDGHGRPWRKRREANNESVEAMQAGALQDHRSGYVQTMTKPIEQFGCKQREENSRSGNHQPSRLLRTKYAVLYLGVSPWQLRRLIQKGQIPVVQYRDGAPWLVDRADLDRWITEKKQVIPL
jgi:excisionase family DNA binding protein